ncbi:MAG: ChbG/HpnK family deacetylase [Spiroplasma sp.]|nr:ChbG/HpnK family deacetylase [Mycoplasmatales bacterium]
MIKKAIILNCDDLGLSNSVNNAVEECYKIGIMKSGTVLVNSDSYYDAINYFSKQEDFSCGIHFVLTFGKATTTNLKYCVDENNNFIKGSGSALESLFSKESEVDLELEFREQLKKFIDVANTKPSHIDSHHHVHQVDKVDKIINKIAKELNVSIRSTKGEKYIVNDVTYHEFCGAIYNVFTLEKFEEIIANNKTNTEYMVHIAKTNDTRIFSSYVEGRVKEYDLLINNKEYLLNKYIFRKKV